MKKKKLSRRGKIILVILGCILLSVVSVGASLIVVNKKEVKENKKENVNYKDYFLDEATTTNDKKLYKLDNSEMVEVGSLKSGVSLSLESDSYLDKGYFKLKDKDYYIDYEDLKEYEKEEKDTFYLNYVPYNESIKTKETTNLYQDKDCNTLIASINSSFTFPITIKEEKSLGVVINDNLYYIKRDEGEIVENKNTDLGHTDSIAALVYHFVYDSTNPEEKRECLNANSTICLSDTQFKSHLSYLKENGYYTATMNDLEMFLDKKVQLPYKTAVITIDDGFFVDAAIKVLEELDLHATLFLIGGGKERFESKNLEIHSHSWNLHYTGECPGGQGSPLKCLPKDKILEDLKKSRDHLNGTTVFCYPFFEYNDYAISVLKEAGFTMAFIGGRQRITLNSNKMLLPRYGIVSDTYVEDIARFVKVD